MINLVFSRVSENFNNKLQQLIFPLKIIKSQSEFEEENMEKISLLLIIAAIICALFSDQIDMAVKGGDRG